MFFNDIKTKLDEEGARIANAVKMSDISTFLLFFYMMNLRHPYMKDSPIMERIHSFNEDRDRL